MVILQRIGKTDPNRHAVTEPLAGRAAAERAIERQVAAVTAAAVAFEQRWTLAHLARVAPVLHGKLMAQVEHWNEAVRGDDPDEIDLQGEAMTRGWRAALVAMVAEGAPDSASMVGRDLTTGMVLVIGHQLAASEVAAQYGKDAVFATPDELAAILANVAGWKEIASIKRAFPGAVVTEVRDSLRNTLEDA
jgi:hypothetical protein